MIRVSGRPRSARSFFGPAPQLELDSDPLRLALALPRRHHWGRVTVAVAQAVWPGPGPRFHDTPRVRFKMYTRNPYGTVARWQNPVKIVTEV